MPKKFLGLILLLVLYLGLSYLLQPKLRQVLRVPEDAQIQNSKISTQGGSASGGKDQNLDLISYDCEKGKTAYELLLKKTGGRVAVKEYSFGKLVDTIDDIKGGTEGKYWLYFVEGKSATISADVYRCQNREKIEWKFLTPQ